MPDKVAAIRNDTKPQGARAWIVRVTGVLLVLPALVNAGYDVVATAMKLPRTDAERINAENFKKYFGKTPLARMPVPIKHAIGTVEATFAVYEGGEILVQFGKNSQWFPFPKSDPAAPTVGLSWLFPSAHAQSITSPEPAPIAQQKSSIDRSVLTQEDVFADGRYEVRRIDIRSGRQLSVKQGTVPLDTVPKDTVRLPTVYPMTPIDLESLKRKQ